MKKTLLAFLTALMLMTPATSHAGGPALVVINGKLVKVDNIIEPKVSIVAPAGNVDLGEIVKLEAKVDGDVPAHVKKREFKWTVTERGYVKQFWEQAEWVIFGTGIKSTSIRIGCSVTLTYELETEEVIKRIDTAVDLQVGTPAPAPPEPNPEPAPAPPAPLTGLAANARDWALAVGPANKAQSAPIIANTLTGIAARIGHDTNLTTPQQILVQTKTEINADLTKAGFKPTDWDAWGLKLQDYAYQQYQAGGMRSIEDYKKAWTELAAGLKAVR